jgi:hypothetical protein
MSFTRATSGAIPVCVERTATHRKAEQRITVGGRANFVPAYRAMTPPNVAEE